MILRRLHLGDASSVLAIEEAGMGAPWSITQITSELQVEGGIGFATEIQGALCAFALFRSYPPECELLRLVVHPELRRKGVAAALLHHGLAQCAHQGCRTCFLEVRASNLAALNLYAALGFRENGRRKCYYTNPDEDALLLHREII